MKEELRKDWKLSVVIRDKWKYSFDGEIDFPRIIQFETHNYCNARCIMCPYETVKDVVPHGFMEKELFKKIIDEIIDYNSNLQYELLPFMNNEPMLDERISEFITYMKEKLPNAAVSVYTNGSYNSIQVWEKLLFAKPDSIVFSINSIEEKEYQRITGNLLLDITLRNLKHVLNEKNENGLTDVELMVHMLRLNKSPQKLLTIMKYWKEFGVNCRTGYIENRGGTLDIDSVGHDQNFLAPNKCWRVLVQIHIAYDGNVILCCGDWKREVVFGNLYKKSIYDIWNSQMYREIRKAHRDKKYDKLPQLCKKCNMKGNIM